jgi:hypothetical protein
MISSDASFLVPLVIPSMAFASMFDLQRSAVWQMPDENTSRHAVFFSYLGCLKTPYLSSLKTAYSVLGRVERHGKCVFVPDAEAPSTAEDLAFYEVEFQRSSAVFDEVAGLQFRQRLAQLLLRVHDDGTIPRHRFFDRLTRDQQKADALITGLNDDLISAVE